MKMYDKQLYANVEDLGYTLEEDLHLVWDHFIHLPEIFLSRNKWAPEKNVLT